MSKQIFSMFSIFLKKGKVNWPQYPLTINQCGYVSANFSSYSNKNINQMIDLLTKFIYLAWFKVPSDWQKTNNVNHMYNVYTIM